MLNDLYTFNFFYLKEAFRIITFCLFDELGGKTDDDDENESKKKIEFVYDADENSISKPKRGSKL